MYVRVYEYLYLWNLVVCVYIYMYKSIYVCIHTQKRLIPCDYANTVAVLEVDKQVQGGEDS